MGEQNNPRREKGQRLSKWIVKKLRPSHFRLPSDGRKWRASCKERKEVLLQFWHYASRDGRNIRPAIKTIAEDLECDPRTVKRRVKELRELRLLENDGPVVYKQPRRRVFNLHRAAELLGLSDSSRAGSPPGGVPREVWAAAAEWLNDGEIAWLRAGIQHLVEHVGWPEHEVVDLFQLAAKGNFMGLWSWNQLECLVPGCVACVTVTRVADSPP